MAVTTMSTNDRNFSPEHDTYPQNICQCKNIKRNFQFPIRQGKKNTLFKLVYNKRFNMPTKQWE